MASPKSTRSTVMSMQVLHSSYFHPVLRSWTAPSAPMDISHFMLPIFIHNKENLTSPEPISSLPGVFRYNSSQVIDFLRPLVKEGLSSILLFPVVDSKTCEMFKGDKPKVNPVLSLIPLLLSNFPELLVAADVCLCAFTSHGHCAILDESRGTIDAEKTLDALVKLSQALAESGVHMLAPSDMMDGRVRAIKDMLRRRNLSNKVSLMAYSAKFASCFYGPFRDAAGSAPAFGDRRSYQLPTPSLGLALRATDRDVAEGADCLMVKPGLAYLDVVQAVKKRHPNHVLAIYQVSGEFAMLVHGADKNLFDLRDALTEVVVAMRRAGADLVISYFVPRMVQWMREERDKKGV